VAEFSANGRTRPQFGVTGVVQPLPVGRQAPGSLPGEYDPSLAEPSLVVWLTRLLPDWLPTTRPMSTARPEPMRWSSALRALMMKPPWAGKARSRAVAAA
jgi:hypothetical protein